jgi:ABC-type sugar transport system ATPase subunit
MPQPVKNRMTNSATTAPRVEMRAIRKVFPGVRALDDVDFTLYPGEIHALLGENGAGKSTLIKILTGALERDGGDVLLEGRSVHFGTTGEAQARRRRAGFPRSIRKST